MARGWETGRAPFAHPGGAELLLTPQVSLFDALFRVQRPTLFLC